MMKVHNLLSGIGHLVVCVILTATIILPKAASAIPAFPTAEGFGANAVGGRGGQIIKVTNLNNGGVGSLRACAEGIGPRICVFKVSGTISLNKHILIKGIDSSYLTIAGQTAPGDGVQIKNYGISVSYGAHDVVIRHLKVRQGTDALPQDINTDCLGMGVYGPASETSLTYNVIYDHVSVQWVCDDGISLYGTTARDVTVQWSLIGEGLINADYQDANNKGIVAAGSGTTWSLHHNLFVHSGARNPQTKGSPGGLVTLDWRNNIVYNWNSRWGNAHLGEDADHGIPGNNSNALVNFVGNKYILGNSTPAATYGLGRIEGLGTRVYHADNWTPYCQNNCSTLQDLGFTDAQFQPLSGDGIFGVSTPFPAPPIIMTPLNDLEAVLVVGAGAHKPVRDSLDTRLIDEFQNRTGSVGRNGEPWPILLSGTIPLDSDQDGMPDIWEDSHGLDPDDMSDGSQVSSNGYTNVENYLNELAGDAIPAGPEVLLTVNLAGSGTGLVTSAPTGISCGSTCTAPYDVGTTVTLTAIPTSGSTFDSWSGGGCSGSGTCVVTVTQANTVTATFSAPSTFPPSVASPAPGSTLTSTTVTFTGGHTSQDYQHYAYVGDTPGGTDYYVGAADPNHQFTASGLPSSGTIHVRYRTRTCSSCSWETRDHTYTMNVP